MKSQSKNKVLYLLTTLACLISGNANAVPTQISPQLTTNLAYQTICSSVFPSPLTPTASILSGMPVQGGGTLNYSAFDEAVIDDSGARYFFSKVNGSNRDRGLFKVEGSTLTNIAIGCSSGIGCGDPAPGGGTFREFYDESVYVDTSISGNGSIVFLATVDGTAHGHGLFYKAKNSPIVLVAIPGQAVNSSEFILDLGVPTVNNSGRVVFPAKLSNQNFVVVSWKQGVFSIMARRGTQTPSGMIAYLPNFSHDVGFGYNTVRPAIALNNRGAIAFYAVVTSNGQLSVPLLLKSGSQVQEIVATGDPAPGGGTFNYPSSVSLNDNNEVAFTSYILGGSVPNGWFVASGANIRVAAYSGMPLGTAYGDIGAIASTNSGETRSLDNCGNLVFHTEVFSFSNTRDTIVLARPNGTVEVVAQAAQPPVGGLTYGFINLTPSINNRGELLITPFWQNGGVASFK